MPKGKSQEEACTAFVNLAAEVTASFLLLSAHKDRPYWPPRFKGQEYRLVGGTTEELQKTSCIALVLT